MKSRDSRPDCLRLNPGVATDWLCLTGQATRPLWASFFFSPLQYEDNNNRTFHPEQSWAVNRLIALNCFRAVPGLKNALFLSVYLLSGLAGLWKSKFQGLEKFVGSKEIASDSEEPWQEQ